MRLNILRIMVAASVMLAATTVSVAQHTCDVSQALRDKKNAVATGKMATLRMDDGKILLEIPTEFVGKDMLFSSCVAKSTHYRYAEVGFRPQVFGGYFERAGDKVYLKKLNTKRVGNESDPNTVKSLRDNNIDFYVLSLKLIDATSTSLTVDATELFLSDAVFSAFGRFLGSRATVKYRSDLSHVLALKAFDNNFSVRTLMSYDLTPKDGRKEICSAEVVCSALLLPEQPMRPRLTDMRIGLFSEDHEEVDLLHSDYFRETSYIERWRVEPSDWEAWKRGEKVRPTKQIVYYIDDEFPESWKEPLKKGILEWNEVFEDMGLLDVIAVRDYPKDDPDFDEDNLAYNCIRYIPTDRGGAMGPSWSDPRTGENLCADVYVWASIMEFANKTCFVQTAQVNKAIRSGKISDQETADHFQCVINHEIGHTLGLAHNMAGSHAYSVDSLLDADFVRRNGLSASTMDYIYFNYIVPPGREDVPLMYTNLGPYDKMVLKYIYYPTDPQLSKEEDQKIVEKFIDEHAGDPRYRYSTQQWGIPYDGSCVIYDISDDPIRSGDLGMSNLKYVVAHMGEWLAGPDKVRLRHDLYEEALSHYYTMVKNNLWYTGGIYVSFVKEGLPGKNFESVPHQLQKDIFAWVANEIRHSDWLNNRELTQHFTAKVDASYKIVDDIASDIIGIANKVSLSSHLSSEPYTFGEYTGDIYDLYFAAPARQSSLTETDKVMQRSLLKYILKKSDPKATTDDYLIDGIATRSPEGVSPLCDERSFGLYPQGDALRNIPVGLISEQKAHYYLLVERIEALAAQKLQKTSASDRAHWLTIQKTAKKFLSE